MIEFVIFKMGNITINLMWARRVGHQKFKLCLYAFQILFPIIDLTRIQHNTRMQYGILEGLNAVNHFNSEAISML